MDRIISTLVIEDEPMALRNMVFLLTTNFPQIHITGTASSVRESVEWLRAHPGQDAPDLIFMDVELSDGDCFGIFRETIITSQVVITTAYDSYAVKAFETGSIDYLLKPVDVESLRRAVSRVEERLRSGSASPDFGKACEEFRSRFLIRLGDRILPVNTGDIAYLYSESKNSWIVTRQGRSYVMDESLDTIEKNLDPSMFFRISRSAIVAEGVIDSISKLLGGRLKIILKKGVEERTDLTVSRARSDAFLSWMSR